MLTYNIFALNNVGLQVCNELNLYNTDALQRILMRGASRAMSMMLGKRSRIWGSNISHLDMWSRISSPQNPLC